MENGHKTRQSLGRHQNHGPLNVVPTRPPQEPSTVPVTFLTLIAAYLCYFGLNVKGKTKLSLCLIKLHAIIGQDDWRCNSINLDPGIM
jgi:hypothetical protein